MFRDFPSKCAVGLKNHWTRLVRICSYKWGGAGVVLGACQASHGKLGRLTACAGNVVKIYFDIKFGSI